MNASGDLSRRGLLGGICSSLSVLAFSLQREVARAADLLDVDRSEGLKGGVTTHLRRYRVRATITLLSVPLFSKDNVGGACAMIEQTGSGSSRLSSIQFSSGSWPEHLKGFNRFGMAQEVVRGEGSAIAESAYLSFMTSSAEKNLDQAKKSFAERSASQQITVAHGRARVSEYASALDHLTVPGKCTWADAPRLISEMKDRLSPLPEAIKDPQSSSAYQPFLHTVRSAMTSRLHSGESVFVHNAKLYRLHTKMSTVAEGQLMIGKIEEVGTRQESEFRVWFDPQDASGLPLRFEFRPKSFLHLVFEQDPAVTGPPLSSMIAPV
jgi:hypothetical protein